MTTTKNGRHWRTAAACRAADPELFFPAAEAGPAHDAQVVAAKAVCAGCPVRRPCLAYALEQVPHGVVGGLTEEERRGVPRASTSSPSDLPFVGSHEEAIAAARRARAAEVSRHRVAEHFGVTVRTVDRWVADDAVAASRCAGGAA